MYSQKKCMVWSFYGPGNPRAAISALWCALYKLWKAGKIKENLLFCWIRWQKAYHKQGLRSKRKQYINYHLFWIPPILSWHFFRADWVTALQIRMLCLVFDSWSYSGSLGQDQWQAFQNYVKWNHSSLCKGERIPQEIHHWIQAPTISWC